MEQYSGYIISPYDNDKIINSVRLSKSNESIEIEFSLDSDPHSHRYYNISVINGAFNGLGQVSLINCENIGMTTGSGGYQKKYSVQYLFAGDQISDLECKHFDIMKVEIAGLLRWTKLTAIKNEFFSSRKISVQVIPNIPLLSTENYEVELYSNANYNFTRENNQVSVKESVGLKIQSKDRCLSTKEFLTLLVQFQKLFFILGNINTKPEQILFFNDNEHGIKLFTKNYESLGIPDTINPGIEFKNLLPNINSIIKDWLEKTEMHTSIDLILEKSINAKLSVENYFLNNCFAIETLHRRFKNFKIIDRSEFKQIRDKVLAAIENIEVREIIGNNLAHISEPNLRRRLEDFKTDFSKVLPQEFDVDSFLGRVVKTRNFLVHRSSSKAIFDNFEMLYAAIFIEQIVKINIFRILKIDETLVQKSLSEVGNKTISMYEFNKFLVK